jgi:ketopantoate reductase
MRVCVFGAGAVGGHIAAKLAAAGHEVSAVARGANLAAVRANGIALREGARTYAGRLRASDKASDLGAQDVVFVTTKATALARWKALRLAQPQDTHFVLCRTASLVVRARSRTPGGPGRRTCRGWIRAACWRAVAPRA